MQKPYGGSLNHWALILKSLNADELNKKRKQRLRKKLRTGEFQELGLSINIGFNKETTTFDSALDKWIEFVESKGWAFGGGGNEHPKEFSGFIYQPGRGTLLEQDRAAIQEWLKKQPWVTEAVVHEPQDAWHGHD